MGDRPAGSWRWWTRGWHMDAVEGQTTEERSLVRKAEVAFGRVRADALPRGLSRELIREIG